MENKIKSDTYLLRKNRDFSKLLLATSLSEIGTQMQRFGLPLIIYHLTGSGTLMSLNFSISLIPGLIFGIVGGIISDRISRKKVLLFGDLLSFILIMLVLLIKNFEGNLSIVALFILTFSISSLTSVYSPTFNASIPTIVNKKDMVKVNNIFTLIESFLGLLGPSIAGIIIGLFGPWTCIMINGLSYLISFLIITRIHSNLTSNDNSSSKSSDIKADIIETIVYVKRNKWFLFSSLIIFTVYLATGSVGSVLQYFFLNYLHLSGFMFGFTFVVFEFLPVLLVSLTSNYFTKKFDYLKLIQISGAIFCISILLLGLSLNYIIVLLIGMMQNASFALLMIAWNSKIQVNVPNKILGKINGTLVTFQSILLPLGAITSTILISFISVPQIMILFGCLTILILIILYMLKYKVFLDK